MTLTLAVIEVVDQRVGVRLRGHLWVGQLGTGPVGQMLIRSVVELVQTIVGCQRSINNFSQRFFAHREGGFYPDEARSRMVDSGCPAAE